LTFPSIDDFYEIMSWEDFNIDLQNYFGDSDGYNVYSMYVDYLSMLLRKPNRLTKEINFSVWLKTNIKIVKESGLNKKVIKQLIKLKSINCGYYALLLELKMNAWDDNLIFEIIGLYIRFLKTKIN